MEVLSRGVFIEVPYSVEYNIKSTCSTKAKNDLRKLARDFEAELARCEGGVSPTPSPSLTPSPSPTPTPNPSLPALPMLAEWETNMINFGRQHCAALQGAVSSGSWGAFADTYYDATSVFLQIAEYTGLPEFLSCADAAKTLYLRWVKESPSWPSGWGGVPGYWNFTDGFSALAIAGDAEAREAAVMLSENAIYARDDTPEDVGNENGTQPWSRSRENAYALMSYMNAESLGEARRAKFGVTKEHAKGHFQQWFVTSEAEYIRPFMVALSSEALFRANEIEPDPAIVPLIENGWNSLFTSSFDSVSGCFQYTDRVHATGGTELACDLNNLIAPQLFRLYQATGQDLWRQRADAVFAGGVRGSYFAGPKQFNQNYWLAIDFVKRRTGG